MKYFVFFSFLFISVLPSHAEQTFTEIIKEADLTEVAKTISQKKIHSVLPLAMIKTWRIDDLQSIVLLAALDCIRIDSSSLKSIRSNIAPEKITQCDFLQPLTLTYNKAPKVMTSLLNNLLLAGIIQGYNIKHTNGVSHFEPSLNVILYGHQTLVHAKQLVALLTLNNVAFSWELIPKTSAFKIREGWQDAKMSELFANIRYSQEFDLKFIFTNHHEKLKFMPLINQFAKRDSKKQQGLIIDAWWQPFYRSFNEEKTYQKVKRISLKQGNFFASTLALNEQHHDVEKKIKRHLKNLVTPFELDSENIWVNPAFYRYLYGDYQ
jgi:hypothetical protein